MNRTMRASSVSSRARRAAGQWARSTLADATLGRSAASRAASAIVFVSIVAAGGAAIWHLWPKSPAVSVELAAEGGEADESRASISLSIEKLAAAAIETSTVARRSMQPSRTVPGRLQYDNTRHVDVKTAMAGVIAEIRVKTGDQVTQGQVLAVLSSQEIGNARADVLARRADLQVAVQNCDWEQTTSDGLKRLAEAVRKRRALEDIRREFQDVRLGAVRETILAAYSRRLLAEKLAESIETAAASGAISGKTVQERLGERESADASLTGLLEQALFSAEQQRRTAEAAVEDARRRLQIAEQHLATLLGYEESLADLEVTGLEATNLSLIEVRAPFAGTIERMDFSMAERVEPTDSLFVLADATRLWVAADVREQEWAALALATGDTVRVSSPALPNRQLEAEVYFVGREVDPATNAVPLVARIDNSDGRLRPGLFVRVTLHVGQPRDVLAVPHGAVCDHDGMRFVFTPVDHGAFERIDIRTGLDDGEWVEVINGLEEGQSVVSEGAFYLKSELLLESEGE